MAEQDSNRLDINLDQNSAANLQDDHVERAAQLLLMSRDHLALFVAQAPVAIALFDCSMNYLAVSQSWVKAFGKGRSSLTGLNHYELHPDLPERWKDAHARALNGEAQSSNSDLWEQPDGTQMWLRWDARPWLKEDGFIGGIILYCEDITLQQIALNQLLTEQKRLRTLLHSAVDAILLVDGSETITESNPATTRLFGYSRNQLVGKKVKVLARLESVFASARSQSCPATSTAPLEAEPAPVVVGIQAQHRDNSLVSVELSCSYDKHLDMFTIIFRDVSERKSLEQQILAAAENEQQRIAQELHDTVQQELTASALMASSLVEVISSLSCDSANNQSDQIARVKVMASSLLTNLVSSGTHIRDLAHGLMPEVVEPDGLIGALQELVTRNDKLNGMRCTFISDATCELADSNMATQLYRICKEAINNAQRHSRATQLVVSLVQKPAKIVLEVHDNGIGIAAIHQTDSCKGIGLRTMKYRASLIGGDIWLHPRTGGGTVVSCTVQRTDKPRASQQSGPHIRLSTGKSSISSNVQ